MLAPPIAPPAPISHSLMKAKVAGGSANSDHPTPPPDLFRTDSSSVADVLKTSRESYLVM